MTVTKMTDEEVPLKYPKAVFFIISTEFCERFCYFGLRTILVLFLADKLQFTESDSKVTYHTFSMLAYFFPLIGGIVSDSWLGKFNVIFYVSMVYAAACMLLAATSADSLKLPQMEFTLLSLVLIAIGTGGIKPCVSAFGGDQFVLPQQQEGLENFFSLFYFGINAGSLLSTILTPILRTLKCMGSTNSCYPVAFGVSGIVMVLGVVLFGLGRPLYKIVGKKQNILLNVTKCISHALVHRSGENPGNHWLDRSAEKYGSQLVNDIKVLLKVLMLYIPLPIFWALYDQQGSGWTFQAVRMNGDCGFFTILPDQMQVANPLIVLVLLPLFSYIIYPGLAKLHLLRKPLQKICCGGFIAALAFILSSLVALALERTYPVLPSTGEAQLRFYDATNCQYSSPGVDDLISGFEINGYHVDKSVKVKRAMQVTFNFTSTSTLTDCTPRDVILPLEEKTAYGIYITNNDEGFFVDNIKKSDDGYPLLRTITSNTSMSVTYTHVTKGESMTVQAGNHDLMSVQYVGEQIVEEIKQKVNFQLGGTYTVLINQELSTVKTIVVTEPNSVHMMWLMPQYVVITIAEVMFSVTGMEFAYSEAPSSMKAVVQSFWLLNVSLGNLLVVFVEKLGSFELQSLNFMVYAGLMVVTMLIFTLLAMNYKGVQNEPEATE